VINKKIKRALIVKAPYAMQEVEGLKKLECRSNGTGIREVVGIIQAGSGTIIGEVEIWDSFKFSEKEKVEFKNLHQVEDISLLDKWCFGWALKNPIKYDKPIKYNHPQGAQNWVRLDIDSKGDLK